MITLMAVRRASRLAVLLALVWAYMTPAPIAAQSFAPSAGQHILAAAAIEGTPLLAALIMQGPPTPASLPSRPTWLTLIDSEGGGVQQRVELPPGRATLVADPGGGRVFVSTYPNHLNIFELATGRLRSVAPPSPWSVISGTLVYNPATNRLYVGGSLGGPDLERRTLVFDGDGRFLSELPFEVVAVDPGLNRLYARATLRLPPTVGDSLGLRVLAVDGATDQPIGLGDLLVLNEPAADLKGLAVDRHSHQVFVLTCTHACWPKTLHVFDGSSQALLRSASRPEPAALLALNEAAGHYYIETHGPGSFTDSLSVADDTVRARWHAAAGSLLAVDGVRNRLYFDHSVQQRYHRFFPRSDEGRLALAVADGATDTVIRVIPLGHDEPPAEAEQAPLPAGVPHRFFPETGRTAAGAFLTHWEQNGGLALFGYPLSETVYEQEPGTNGLRAVQYFERALFWLDVEATGDRQVVRVAPLGLQFAAIQAPITASDEITADRRAFAATGHTLAYGFKHYWEVNGGLAAFGYPITEELEEVSSDDGQRRRVQYFERARFEYHPEHAGTPAEVELGRLGEQALRARGWTPARSA